LNALYIALFGALGSVSRYGVGLAALRFIGRGWAGTLAVNIVGSLLMGSLVGWFSVTGDLDTRMRLALTTGLLGGFTTYSAFALETVSLLEKRQTGAAAAYMAATLVLAGGACFLGLAIGRRLG